MDKKICRSLKFRM